MINELAKAVYENAKSKGFYDNGKANNTGEQLCLIHSEVSEALEADRKDNYADLEGFLEREREIINSYTVQSSYLDNEDFKDLFKSRIKDTFEDELADIILRCLNMAAHKGIDIEKHLTLKMKFNSLREYMHGKKY